MLGLYVILRDVKCSNIWNIWDWQGGYFEPTIWMLGYSVERMFLVFEFLDYLKSLLNKWVYNRAKHNMWVGIKGNDKKDVIKSSHELMLRSINLI